MPTVAELFPLLARDLVSVLAARADCDHALLDAFARRRAGLYEHPESPPTDDAYFIGLAVALAPVAPPEWMPMAALIESGATLEGGPRGLRGLIFKEPSDREKRRVTKLATLVARIFEIVASATRAHKADEQRRIAMALASFGLSPDELARIRPAAAVTFENLDIFGELDVRTRHDLLEGAWQLALLDALDPSRDVVVRGIAARLESSEEYDASREKVVLESMRRADGAAIAVSICRDAARLVDAARLEAVVQRMLDAYAPPSQRDPLLAMFRSGGGEPTTERLDPKHRRQAVAIAFATLLATEPPFALGYPIRATIRAAASRLGVDSQVADAFDLVDRFFYDQLREHTLAPPAAPPDPQPPTG